MKLKTVSIVTLVPPLPLAMAEPIVIKFSHVVAVDTPKGKARVLQETREERTKGVGQGRGLSEQQLVQGQGGDGGAAARLGARCSPVAGQVWSLASRSSNSSTCPSFSTATMTCTR